MDTAPFSSPPASFLSGKGLLIAFAGCLLLSSCQISVSPRDYDPDTSVHSPDDFSASMQQIRLRMRSLVDPMSGEIEAGADKVIAATDDPAVKRAAVEWKAQGIPALREALFQPEPLTAVFDTWVLTNQMIDYFSTGPGSTALGDNSGIAVATSRRLEGQVHEVAVSFTKTKDLTGARNAARGWAAAHPIRTEIAHRESTLSRAVERNLGPALSATESAGNMMMTIDDLNRRVEVYTDQLIRQVHWEAELITMDLTSQLELDQAIPLATRAVNSLDIAVGSLQELMPDLERALDVAETAPQLIADERTVAIKAVQDELTRTIDFVREERTAALEHVTKERLAALDTLHESIIQEREKATHDAERISIDAIDHVFLRAGQLVATVLAAVIITAAIGMFLTRRYIRKVLREYAENISSREGAPT